MDHKCSFQVFQSSFFSKGGEGVWGGGFSCSTFDVQTSKNKMENVEKYLISHKNWELLMDDKKR